MPDHFGKQEHNCAFLPLDHGAAGQKTYQLSLHLSSFFGLAAVVWTGSFDSGTLKAGQTTQKRKAEHMPTQSAP